ncbi:MAG: BON domain-containing protein [Planctomycetaceae bacterium]
MRRLVLVMLCGAVMGCSEGPSSTSRSDANMEDPVPVTANRPLTTEHPANATDTRERDNSEVNVRDRDGDTKTPIDQNENAADIEITANIRSKIVATEMSVAAQNVKIITQDRKVTLRGPVRTEQEKQSVEDIAKGVAGTDNVDSQLEVDPD